MNIQEIQTGNFSSVKGSWRNEQGNSITFDANGLIQVNGKPAGDVVFDKFVVKGEKLTAVTKTSEGISETPIVFTPSGQIIYGKYKASIGQILRLFCERKGV